MATGRGVDILLGIVKQPTWTNTGVTVNATGLGIRPTSFSYEENIEELPDESYNGNPLRRDTTNTGRARVSGTFGFDVKCMGLEVALALFMGVDTKTGAGPNYTHLLTTKSIMDGISATMAWWDGIHVHEIPALKFTRLALRGTAGGVMTGELGWVGRTRTENATNNTDAGKLSTMTEGATIDRIPITSSVTTYQIDTKGGSSMAAIALSNWEIVMERTYDSDDRVFTSTAAPYIDEPSAGRLSCTGSLTIAPYSATTYLTGMTAGTLYEIQLKHVVTASTKEFHIFLPSVKFTTGNVNPSDFGAIPLPMGFVVDLAGTAMTESATTGPALQIINQNATAAV